MSPSTSETNGNIHQTDSTTSTTTFQIPLYQNNIHLLLNYNHHQEANNQNQNFNHSNNMSYNNHNNALIQLISNASPLSVMMDDLDSILSPSSSSRRNGMNHHDEDDHPIHDMTEQGYSSNSLRRKTTTGTCELFQPSAAAAQQTSPRHSQNFSPHRTSSSIIQSTMSSSPLSVSSQNSVLNSSHYNLEALLTTSNSTSSTTNMISSPRKKSARRRSSMPAHEIANLHNEIAEFDLKNDQGGDHDSFRESVVNTHVPTKNTITEQVDLISDSSGLKQVQNVLTEDIRVLIGKSKLHHRQQPSNLEELHLSEQISTHQDINAKQPPPLPPKKGHVRSQSSHYLTNNSGISNSTGSLSKRVSLKGVGENLTLVASHENDDEIHIDRSTHTKSAVTPPGLSSQSSDTLILNALSESHSPISSTDGVGSNSSSFSDLSSGNVKRRRSLLRDKSFPMSLHTSTTSAQSRKKNFLSNSSQQLMNSMKWWEHFDIMPLILSFISRSEQRCVARWVCKRWALIVIDADYDAQIVFSTSPSSSNSSSPSGSNSALRRMTSTQTFSRKGSSSAFNLSHVALIHHSVARGFCGEDNCGHGFMYRFCDLIQNRIHRQEKVAPQLLNDSQKFEWNSHIQYNVWNEEHWKAMNDLRKKRALTISSSNFAAKQQQPEKRPSKFTFFSKTSITEMLEGMPQTSHHPVSSTGGFSTNGTSHNIEDMLNAFPYFIKLTNSKDTKDFSVVEELIRNKFHTNSNFYLQFFFVVCQQPHIFNELCKLGNANLHLAKENKQPVYNATMEQILETFIANHAVAKMSPEMLLYKLFERVFTLDIENHSKFWLKCFPSISSSSICKLAESSTECKHDIFKQFLFEVEMLLDIFYIWIKDFGLRRESAIDLYDKNLVPCTFLQIELIEHFASYAICHCSFSNNETIIHKKCLKIFKLIDHVRESLDFESYHMLDQLVLRRNSWSDGVASNNNGTLENPLIAATKQSKCILIPENLQQPLATSLCSIEDLVTHQFILMDYLFRHVSFYEVRTLAYKANNAQSLDPSQIQEMAIKKLVLIFNNLSNYLTSMCLMEESLERRSQILERIQQCKALSFHMNDFSTTLICDSATNSSALTNNKFTITRSQELMGKELCNLVATISEKCSIKGLRQEALSKEMELIIPNLGAFLTEISFIGEYNQDLIITPNYGATYNCHKFHLMTQTMKRITARRMRKPSLHVSPVSQLPEKTRNLILKRKLSEKIKAKLKLIPQQHQQQQQQPSSLTPLNYSSFNSIQHIKVNTQILEFLAFLLFQWQPVDDKTLHELALRNEPRKAKKEQIKP
ncbi:hypothetical protein C9374_002888 [Naegleria lovaniensis]|uniref:Ras-GEF domain-containing protein n=1 Tax=Naegleria lovaniensis TaxID=51637 RepID=A0AA88GTA9_NAELO|nr:uncharacterized protein C9374_002888 [Naegleria lovaniensis]KAG2385739.1 hypothetical protein C9374_002888 [Naegleria lovaniensis]